MSSMADLSQQLRDVIDRGVSAGRENPKAAYSILGGVTLIGACSLYSLSRKRENRKKPTSFDLSLGSIGASEGKAEFTNYSNAYGVAAGEGIRAEERANVVKLVNTFYSLVTDIYEWGWGTSFHFAPGLPGKSIPASEAAHEARIAGILGLKPGSRALDVGCGVGGPMRTIASTSGSHVTGITINDYQVKRAQYHNEQLGLSELCEVLEGDYLKMPFKDATFDSAYAIEATCHAPQLETVYAEIGRVLKPGALFVSYEWVATAVFDAKNPEHVRIIDEINFGNGLPEMRTIQEAEEAGRAAGFELVDSRDIADTCPPCDVWYSRLMFGRPQHLINHAIVSVLSFLHLVPTGTKEVHKMLIDVVVSLVAGGKTGIFSPMHMLVFRKPLGAAE